MIARKHKKQVVERAVVVDVADKPVVWATGDIVPCQCSFFLQGNMTFSNIF